MAGTIEDPPPEVLKEVQNKGIRNKGGESKQIVMDPTTKIKLQQFFSIHNQRLADILRDGRFTWGY